MTDSMPEPKILNSLGDTVCRATSVLAGMQLDLFTPLKDGPLRADQIAASLGVQEAKLSPLLYALVVVGLLTVEDGLFANTAEADYYLVRGRPSYRGQRHKFFSDIWRAELRIAESIRTGKPQAAHDYANMSEDELFEFMDGMHRGAFDDGLRLAHNYNFSSYQTVVDVGGGSGGVAIGLVEALPHLKVTVVELPSVAKVARRFVEQAGAAERVQIKAVDVVCQPLMGTYDAAVLRNVLHVISIEEAYQVLLKTLQALKPGGTIYIFGQPLDDSRLTPEYWVLFHPVYAAIYECGQGRTVQEYRDLLTKAGFDGFELHADKIITARKPVHTDSIDIHRQ
jgi:predicted O-methyltransferase YrrM